MPHRGTIVPINPPLKQKKGGFIYTAGYIATIMAAIATSGVVAALVLSLPEIRHYLKISSM